MNISRLIGAALALSLVACGASSSKSASPAPASPAAAPVTPGEMPAPTATAGAVPEAPRTENEKSASGPGQSAPAAPRGTSPTGDVGPSDVSATNPSTKRLEDVKTEKSTGTGGSYSVAVKSAAGLVPDDVGKAVNGAAAKTDACYAKAIKKKPAAGSATLFEVGVDGKGVGAVKLVSDGLKDADWSKCLEAALKGVSWPKPTEKTGKTTVEFSVK